MTKKKSKYAKCLRYIDRYWEHITCSFRRDKHLHLGLPNRFICPTDHHIFKNDQFYWDSYFIILGLVKSKKIKLAKGMIDNFCFLFRRFGIIPMRNRYYNLGTSQIPFLTSMILEVFSETQDKKWLKKVTKTAEAELEKYWMNEKLTEKHIVFKGLSRYCDHYITHLGAEHESGWDMTSRFNNHCLDFLPVDLNCCLYKYETDLAHIYALLKNPTRSSRYRKQSEKRAAAIKSFMWSKHHSFFFDFNKQKDSRSKFYSVAGFYPMWAKLATKKQALYMRNRVLPLFEHQGGIVNTLAKGLSNDIKQHDYPNGWPPQQWIVIKGLLNYGFREDAKRIAVKWLDMNARLFSETSEFWEKHDVINSRVGAYNPDRYVTQSGFAWTNAVFVRLVEEFSLK